MKTEIKKTEIMKTEAAEMKKLGFGTMRMPLHNSEDPTDLDVEQVCRMVDVFLEQGFTYFDTAYMYHKYESERVVKKALVDRYPRERFVLADKLPLSHLKQKEDMERFFNEQLEKCGVEYFDYYLLHNVSRSSYETAERLDAFGFAREKKAAGRIKKLGFSFHADAELLEQILKTHPEVEFVQLQLNYIDWDSLSIQSRQCYELCRRYGKEVIVMEPVKGGILAQVPEEAEKLMKSYAPKLSPASWAIRFAASQEGVIMVLSGMSDMDQMLDNISYMKEFQPLNEEEQAIIRRVTEIINASIAVACTGCQYCVEGCPKQIPIPRYFALYNQFRQFAEKSNSRGYYANYQKTHGMAKDCIGCRKCEKICPQHLSIADLMKDVSAVFDVQPEA